MTSMPLSTRVERVVVHSNGALVTRRGVVAAGSTDVVVTDLPLLFASDTLRVRPVGAGCSVGVVDEVCRVSVTEAAAVVGEEALLEVRLQIASVEQRRAALKMLTDHAELNVELPPADVDAFPETAVLLRLADGATRRRTALLREIRALDHELVELQREEARRARALRPDEKPPRVLRGVRVAVDAAEDAALEVEYFVPAARWVPSYALQLTSGDKTRARLVLGALVAQASGEDWTDVELRVSTVDLRRDTTLPVLHSWRLGRAQPEKVRGFRPLPSDLPGLFSGFDCFPTPTAATTTTTRNQPAKPAPLPPPPPPQKPRDSFEDHSDGELLSFETERTNAYAAMEAPESADDDEVAAPREESAKMMDRSDRKRLAGPMAPQPAATVMFGASMAPPSLSMASVPRPSAKARGGLAEADASSLGGAGPGGSATVVDELPPRLRTSAMRMAAADEGQRGLLLPLDARRRLEWLLDAADVGGVDVGGAESAADAAKNELRRALNALASAEQRLRARPLPRGTHAVTGAVAASFGRGGRASIPGDGNDHRVEVHAEEGDGVIIHLAVPRESLDVWRACRFQPSGALPSGPVQVYEDGSFVVAAQLKGGGGGKPLVLNLGVDPDVRIKARTPHAHQSEKGMLGGTSQVEHKVITEVRSTRANVVKLSIFERVPVADDNQKDLVVSPVTSKPNALRTDKGPREEELKGGLRFDLTLMPGDATVVEHSYSITLPAKSEVVGGNRRE